MVWWVVVVVLTCCPGAPPVSLFLLSPLSSLLYPSPPYSPLVGCVTSFVVSCVLAVDERLGLGCVDLSCLAEFETPTVFNRAFYFHRSIFSRYHKIVKIIICILYIYKNVSTMLISAIPICGFDYLVISFQNYRISIYIDNTRRF